MKNRIVVISLLLFCFFFVRIDFAGAAGGQGSHGGDALIIDQTPYLLDLVESGVEKLPYFAPDTIIDPTYLIRIQNILPTIGIDDQTQIAHKLSDIARVAPIISEIILRTAEEYSWNIVNLPLFDIHDEDTSDILYDPKLLVQLAARREPRILIDRMLWDALPPGHRAATFFHEVVYALTQVDPQTCTSHENNLCGSTSPRARTVVGFLFSPDFLLRKKDWVLSYFKRNGLQLEQFYGEIYSWGNYSRANPLNLGAEYTVDPKVQVRFSNDSWFDYLLGVSSYSDSREKIEKYVNSICNSIPVGATQNFSVDIYGLASVLMPGSTITYTRRADQAIEPLPQYQYWRYEWSRDQSILGAVKNQIVHWKQTQDDCRKILKPEVLQKFEEVTRAVSAIGYKTIP